jgi:uncharacterized repeat protein (TIGR01451 family)
MGVNKWETRNTTVLFLIALLTSIFAFVRVNRMRFAIARSPSGTEIHPTAQADIPLLNQAWSSSMDFPDQDAELLAMEISGALLPPPSLYNQIHDDLTAIRQAYPQMNSIFHRPRWVPGQLLVGLTPEAWEQFQRGDYHAWDDLNDQYGPVDIIPFTWMPAVRLQFAERYNPEYLAPLYGAIDGVRYAEPVFFIGDGPDILVSLPVYTFKMGWGDCPAGCIYNHYWDFIVVEGLVTLVREYGDPLQSFPALMASKQAAPDPVQAGAPLTYTIYVANTGSVALHATITDTLPTHILPGETSGGTPILPGGTLTWTPIITTPGGVWTVQFSVTTQIDYLGPLTNVARVSTDEGATGTCIVITETKMWVIYLPTVLRDQGQ